MVCTPLLKTKLPPHRISTAVWPAVVLALLCTVGCQPVATPVATGSGSSLLQGSVHGGQQGISGSAIELYAAGTSGDGSSAVPLLTQPVISDAAGGFSLEGLYTCPSADATVYVVAQGGNPGLPGGATNHAIALMALLGPCGSISATTTIRVNEVTTISALWPMARFTSSAFQIGSTSGDPAFAQAVETTQQMADTATGGSPGNAVPDGYAVPSDKLNTLANILAACINSGGGTAGDGTPCGTLFSLTSLAGSDPARDTLTAALRIARNPTANVAALLHLAPISPPFQPTLTAEPADWTLELQRKMSAPTILPAPGSYALGQQITLSSSSVGAVIHYTLDGTIPLATSAIYSSPLTLTASETIRAVTLGGSVSSDLSNASYTVSAPHLVFALQPQTVVAGAMFVPAPVVQIVDAGGVLMPSASSAVTLSLRRPDGSSAALSGSTSASTAGGSVNFPGLSTSEPGAGYVLEASAPGLAIQQSHAFKVLSPAAVTQSTALGPAVPATFFGMSVNHPSTPAPSLPFGTTRSWDADGLAWADLNPASGIYNFTALDTFVAKNQARGAQVIYTFGRTPQWASSQPNTPGSYAPGQCAPPLNLSAWDSYVRAIVTHVAGRIKYWEIWNEPNSPGFYCGQVSTMITLAQHASAIIKSVDPTALVLSPSLTSTSGPQWLGWYLLGGGGAAVDVIAFHGYSGTDPGSLAQVVANYRGVMAANGAAAKPMWNTETSWAGDGDLVTPDMAHQVAFVAKTYLLQWSLGVSRVLWYAYDGGPIWGGLWDPTTGVSAAAVAYGETYRWMVNASLTQPCLADQIGTWTCGFARPGGYTAEAIWRPNASATVPVPAQFTEYRDLSGDVHALSSGSVVIGDQPILLESGPLPQ